ncbi:MAG: toprim domain-containing protein, partial [Treponemataceae bacterium]
LDIILNHIDRSILKKAGIPLVNPQTGVSSWASSGVVLRLGRGLKLHYNREIETKKINSKGGKSFPFSSTLDSTKPLVLMEGELKVLVAQALGIQNVCGIGGVTSVTSEDIKNSLVDFKEIILFFDNDKPGKQACGLMPQDIKNASRLNFCQKLRQAGYLGKIRIASLPSDCEQKDVEDLMFANKGDLAFAAIDGAVEWQEKPTEAVSDYDTITLKQLKSVLKKIDFEDIDAHDAAPFVNACLKFCKNDGAEIEVSNWSKRASQSLIEKDSAVSPDFLIYAGEKYGLSKYLQKELEQSLLPTKEILKKMNAKQTLFDYDPAEFLENSHVQQFLITKGVRSASLFIADVAKENIIYIENEKKHYFFNGHVWQRIPDFAGITHEIICKMLLFLLRERPQSKKPILDLLTKIEGRRFRVELTQDFSGLAQIHKEHVLFDGPAMKETLTLKDGVIDFSGDEVVFRHALAEEFRKEFLPYSLEDVKNGTDTSNFQDFMKSNFKNQDTLDGLLYYLSMIPSRNTQFKYGAIFTGPTHTGKTTTVELIKEIYTGMIERLPADVLVSKGGRRVNGNEATPYISRLEGKGAAIAQETERNGVLNNALWKELTGGDTLTARGLYQMPHDFTPTCQIIMCTNHTPRFDAHDAATIDRMLIYPFMIQHKKGEKGTKPLSLILKKIRKEFPAIVHYFAQKYISLKNEHNGMIPLSPECMSYKELYVKSQETDLDKFVEDCLTIQLNEGYFEQVEDVWQRYVDYYKLDITDKSDKSEMTKNKLVRYLKRDYQEIIYKQKKIDGYPILCFFNIKLKDDLPPIEKLDLKTEKKKPAKAEKPAEKKDEFIPPDDENPFE